MLRNGHHSVDPRSSTYDTDADAVLARATTQGRRKGHVGSPPPPAPKLPGYAFADAVWGEYEPPTELVQSLFAAGEVVFFYGQSGHMKSFVVSDLILHLAAEADWNGLAVDKGAHAVLVVLAEGQGGYRQRLRGWALHHGLEPNSSLPIWICDEPLSLFDSPAALSMWIEEAEGKLGKAISVIVIDTFSTNLGAADEQSNSDVARALNHARLAADGRTVLFVHHTGHADQKRERGAYQIRANADRSILVTRDQDGTGELVTLECVKTKDSEPFKPITLRSQQVDTGWKHKDGRPITTVILTPTADKPEPKAGSKRGRGEVQQLIILALQQAGGTLDNLELRDAIVGRMGKSRQSFSDAMKALKEQSVLGVFGPKTRLATEFRGDSEDGK